MKGINYPWYSGSVPRPEHKFKKRVDSSSSEMEGSGDSVRPDNLSVHSRFGESRKYDILGQYAIHSVMLSC